MDQSQAPTTPLHQRRAQFHSPPPSANGNSNGYYSPHPAQLIDASPLFRSIAASQQSYPQQDLAPMDYQRNGLKPKPGASPLALATMSPGPSLPASPMSMMAAVDFDGLSWPSIGTRQRLEQTEEEKQERLTKLSGALKTVLECLGEDPSREGLIGTPERYAKAMLYFTKGYEENLRDIVNGAVFSEDHDELVIVKDIDVYSLCEHHLVPFTGKMHIGYIPNRRVIGLSKLARIAEMFSRRLQVQERLTKQVALAISEILSPLGVGVIMESTHMCMVMRGVSKASAVTTTSCMLGELKQSAKAREEFLSLLRR